MGKAKEPLNRITICPQCKTKLYGMVKACFNCGYEVNIAEEVHSMRLNKMIEKEERIRSTMWYKLIFALKYSWLKRKSKADQLGIYQAYFQGDKKIALANILFNSTRLSVSQVSRSAHSFAFVESDPQSLQLTLTCCKCGFVHAIFSGYEGGIANSLSGYSIGRFGDRYQAAWTSDFFSIIRKELKAVLGDTRLYCQNCGEEAKPSIRKY